jgi:hypothetical protein
MRVRPAISEIGPEHENGTEQRTDRPHQVHDPHVLRMADFIERDEDRDRDAAGKRRHGNDGSH